MVRDTVYQNAVQHDSVYVDRFVEVSTKGDTVFKTQTEYIYREKQVHDTTVQVVNVLYRISGALSKQDEKLADIVAECQSGKVLKTFRSIGGKTTSWSIK